MSRNLYDQFHLNFTTTLPRSLLEELADSTVASGTSHLISSVYDQHLAFKCLDQSAYDLGLETGFFKQLNAPGASEFVIENLIEKVVAGLFSVAATMGNFLN